MSNNVNQDGCKMLPLKPYTLSELCALYKVTRRTFLEWLRPFKEDIGKREGYYYTIAQVKVIFQKLDLPYISDEDNSGENKIAA